MVSDTGFHFKAGKTLPDFSKGAFIVLEDYRVFLLSLRSLGIDKSLWEVVVLALDTLLVARVALIFL